MKQLFRVFFALVGIIAVHLSSYASYHKANCKYENFDHFAKTCKISYIDYASVDTPTSGYQSWNEFVNNVVIDKYYTDKAGDTFLVTEIADDAFRDLKDDQPNWLAYNMVGVVFPSSIKEINSELFSNCPKLQRISFSDDDYRSRYKVSDKGDELYQLDAIDGASKKTLKWVSRWKEADNFILAKDVDVTPLAFYECRKIQSVTVEEGNPYLLEKHRVLFNADKTELYFLSPAADYLKITSNLKFSASTINVGDKLSVELPSSKQRVESGVYDMFSNSIGLTIPDGVKEIGDRAFKGWARLSKIHLPLSLTKIGESPFEGCYALKEINYGDFPYDAVHNLLCGTGIESFTMPESWPEVILKDCPNIKEITLKDGRIEQLYIDCPKLEKMNYPATAYIDTITRFAPCPYLESGEFEFREGLKNISHPGSVGITYYQPTEHRTGAFEDVTIPAVSFPEALTEIGPYAFANATITDSKTLIVPDGTVGRCAFTDLNYSLSDTPPEIEVEISEFAELWDCAFYNARIKSVRYKPKFFKRRKYEGERPPHFTPPEYVVMCNVFRYSSVSRLDFINSIHGYTADEWNRFWWGMGGLTQIRMYCKTVPIVKVESEEDKWDDYCDNVTLYVPEDLLEDYKTADFWRHFKYIKALPENSGVEDITADEVNAIQVVNGALVVTDPTLPVEVYTLDGICRHSGCLTSPLTLPRGIYIVRAGNESLKVKL